MNDMSRSAHVRGLIKSTGILLILTLVSTAEAGLVYSPNYFGAPSTSGDASWNNFFQPPTPGNAGFYENWSTEGRIGGAATYELGINTMVTRPNLSFGTATNQFDWVSGTVYDFTLQYAGDGPGGIGGLVTWTVDGVTTTTTPPFGLTGDLWIRTRSATGSTLTINNLNFNGVAAPGNPAASSSGNGLVDYMRITGADFTMPFTLTGQVVMTWGAGGAPRPGGSALAFQIKATQPVPVSAVPEPSTIGLALTGGLCGLGLLWRRHRRVARV
jgi:hypothetical protein